MPPMLSSAMRASSPLRVSFISSGEFYELGSAFSVSLSLRTLLFCRSAVKR